jgi:hypothetical protein
LFLFTAKVLLRCIAQALLVKAAPLAGVWGVQRYGLADVAVLAALEGLAGADACAGYKFVEERGPWDAEAKRLEKEALSRSKQQQRVRPAFAAAVLLGSACQTALNHELSGPSKLS